MNILITLLTLLLVANCLILILLVLIQLPKKEAGAGLAFGGGATDALFGSDSGNALTKLTKTFATTFLTLSLIIGLMNAKAARSPDSEVRKQLAAKRAMQPTPGATTPAKPAVGFQTLTPTNLAASAPTTATTNAVMAPAAAATNAAPKPATTATNAPAAK